MEVRNFQESHVGVLLARYTAKSTQGRALVCWGAWLGGTRGTPRAAQEGAQEPAGSADVSGPQAEGDDVVPRQGLPRCLPWHTQPRAPRGAAAHARSPRWPDLGLCHCEERGKRQPGHTQEAV